MGFIKTHWNFVSLEHRKTIMGWWTKKENSEQSHAQEDQDSDDIHKDVLAAGRVACYKARDTFFACVEKSKSKPTEVASVGLLYPAECKAARSEFVKQCRPTWVKHFDRQFSTKKRVERLLEAEGSRKGPMSLPQPYTFQQWEGLASYILKSCYQVRAKDWRVPTIDWAINFTHLGVWQCTKNSSKFVPIMQHSIM